jgi:ribosomal protein L21
MWERRGAGRLGGRALAAVRSPDISAGKRSRRLTAGVHAVYMPAPACEPLAGGLLFGGPEPVSLLKTKRIPMFAVIKTGGKQYKVAEGAEITVEKLEGDAGAKLTFGEVLMIGDGDTITLGAPTLGGASVAGEIVEQTRSDKVITYKKKPRNTYRRKLGHRQHMTVVKITGISAS